MTPHDELVAQARDLVSGDAAWGEWELRQKFPADVVAEALSGPDDVGPVRPGAGPGGVGPGPSRAAATGGPAGRDDDLLPVPNWPVLPPGALTGTAGRLVRLLAPATEADPAAVLACLFAAAGVWMGPGPHVRIANERHPPLVWPLIAGPTSTGAKGTAWSVVRAVMESADPAFMAENRVGGLSSGEGLIELIRDDVGEPTDKDYERGVDDKRLLIVEPELAAVFGKAARQGNVLGQTLRETWDGGTLRTLTRRSSRLTATDHHVGLVGMITPGELSARISNADIAGGTLNRFLPIMSRRSKYLPDGGTIRGKELATARTVLLDAKAAAQPREFFRDVDAERLWKENYERLADGLPGRVGEATARARPHVMRLALLYSLFDGRDVIEQPHMLAALALWRYAQDSAVFLFGNPTSDINQSDVSKVLAFLAAGPQSRENIRSGCFSRNKSKAEIDAMLTAIIRAGLVDQTTEPTRGRPRTVYTLRTR